MSANKSAHLVSSFANFLHCNYGILNTKLFTKGRRVHNHLVRCCDFLSKSLKGRILPRYLYVGKFNSCLFCVYFCQN